MSSPRGALPTLTEVIEGVAGQSDGQQAVCAADGSAALTAEILEVLQPRIDALLDLRLREALMPQLARLAEGAVYCVRGEIATALHTLVAQAVTEALQRRAPP